MSIHNDLIARNARFAATFERGDMPILPQLRTLIVTCIDARVDPAHTFGVSRRFRIPAVNDDCSRENLWLMADTSISGARVARELDALVRVYG